MGWVGGITHQHPVVSQLQSTNSIGSINTIYRQGNHFKKLYFINNNLPNVYGSLILPYPFLQLLNCIMCILSYFLSGNL